MINPIYLIYQILLILINKKYNENLINHKDKLIKYNKKLIKYTKAALSCNKYSIRQIKV